YAHSCHGHTSLSPSRLPCPRGPPACGQMPSSALSSPPTLQIAYVPSPTSASITDPGGSAARDPTFTNAIFCFCTTSGQETSSSPGAFLCFGFLRSTLGTIGREAFTGP